MKRKVLKKRVENLVVGFLIIGVLMIASDSANLTTFIGIHLTGILIVLLSSIILYKYTNIFEREF